MFFFLDNSALLVEDDLDTELMAGRGMNDIIQNDYPEATPPTQPKPAHNRKHRRSYQQSLQAQVNYRLLVLYCLTSIS